MTHRIQTQSIIQSCSNRWEKEQLRVLIGHTCYTKHAAHRKLNNAPLSSLPFKITWKDRSPQGQKQTPTAFLVLAVHPLYMPAEQYLLPALGCELICLCAIKQPGRFSTKRSRVSRRRGLYSHRERGNKSTV